MEEMERYWLWLCSAPGLSGRQVSLLANYFGSPKQVYEAPLEEFDVWRQKQMKWIDNFLNYRKKYSLEEACHKTEQKGIHFISRNQAKFPKRLKHLPDCPAGLFYRGSLPREARPAVAVVGARACTNYGRVMARELGGELGKAGVQVISGLANGIDGYAQEAALDGGGSSFGVLGCGADICYPRENWNIYQKALERGGILSEFPVGTPPLRHHFPLRNRIISGLADVVVVVEARERSGSLITADLALEQGRDVYAVPGRNTDVLSRGCNRLIAQGAGILLSPEWLLEQLHLPGEGQVDSKDFLKKSELVLAPEEKWVYSNLDLLPEGLEVLAEKTDMPPGQLCGILVKLELLGLAAELAKNQYARLK